MMAGLRVSDFATLVVSGVGSTAVAITLVYNARQTKTFRAQLELDTEQARQAATALRASNDLRLMEHVLTLARIFIDAPELRPYFYEGLPVPEQGEFRHRVMATAAYIVDLADSVTDMIRLEQLDPKNHALWQTALRWYGRSPAVQAVARQSHQVWNRETIELLLSDVSGTRHPSARDDLTEGD
jgi:hypothetical protein